MQGGVRRPAGGAAMHDYKPQRTLPHLPPPPQVANLLGEEIPQIYALCGRGPRASLSVLRPGLAVTELAVSPLPGAPTAVWTVRRAASDEYDAYIVVSFANATLVFSIGEEVKETNESGFLGTVPTLHTQLLADNSMLQVRGWGGGEGGDGGKGEGEGAWRVCFGGGGRARLAGSRLHGAEG